MLVKYWLTRHAITVDENVSLMKASRLMKEHGIKHLPVVVSNNRLIGIVSDRDLKEAQPSQASTLDIHELFFLLDKVKVKNVMSTELYTTTGEEIVEKAAALMLEHDISALPVIDEQGELEGIITKSDLFRAMIAISGVRQAQLQFGVEIEDSPGAVKEVTDLIRVHGGRLVSITTHTEDAPQGFRNIYIRCKEVRTEDEEALFAQIADKAKLRYRTHYKID
jgi:acetoin utilization protein AcuB